MGRYKKQVERAAKLMDRELPGWHRMVDLEKLQMIDGAMCLLGQTFGVHMEKCLAKEMFPKEWEKARRAAFIPEGLAKHGYQIGRQLLRKRKEEGRVDAEDLTALEIVCSGIDTRCAWIAEITERRLKDEEEATDGSATTTVPKVV